MYLYLLCFVFSHFVSIYSHLLQVYGLLSPSENSIVITTTTNTTTTPITNNNKRKKKRRKIRRNQTTIFHPDQSHKYPVSRLSIFVLSVLGIQIASFTPHIMLIWFQIHDITREQRTLDQALSV